MSLITGSEPDGVIVDSVFSNEPDYVPPVLVSAIEIIYISLTKAQIFDAPENEIPDPHSPHTHKIS